MTTIVNLKEDECQVYIGRPSKWGNPYSHLPDTLAKYKVKTRSQAIKAYKQWITQGEGKHLLNDLHELKDMTLGCWCKPKQCHGDILIQLINELNRR